MTYEAMITKSSSKDKPRQKRDKYVNCACLECKRRKIKCNGNQPCHRCSHLHLDCVYPKANRARAKSTVTAKSVRPPEPEIFGIPGNVARKFIEAYDSEINSMYPIFNDGELIEMYGTLVKEFLETSAMAENEDLVYCKMAVAIGASISDTRDHDGSTIYNEIMSRVSLDLCSKQSTFELFLTLVMVHQYQFHTDQGELAYRTLAFASTVAFDLGLHSCSILEQKCPDQLRRERYRQAFWCVYVLDKRLSIYAKRPLFLNDEDIDQKMPRLHGPSSLPSVKSTENDLYRAMHLNYMIYYSQIASKMLKGKEPKHIESLMHKWLSSLPPELDFRAAPSGAAAASPPPHHSRKLRAVLHLKATLMLLNIYTASSAKTYSLQAVNAAQECVRELYRLYFHTGLYTSCQIQYNHFLVSALDVLYSAAQQDESYARMCGNELSLALKLVNLLLEKQKAEKHQGSIWQLMKSFAKKLGYTTMKLESTTNSPAAVSPPEFDIDYNTLFEKGPFEVSTTGTTDLLSMLGTGFGYSDQSDFNSYYDTHKVILTPQLSPPSPPHYTDEVQMQMENSLYKTLDELFT